MLHHRWYIPKVWLFCKNSWQLFHKVLSTPLHKKNTKCVAPQASRFNSLRQRSLSYRNKSTDLLCKSMDWFLFDGVLHHEKVKVVAGIFLLSLETSSVLLNIWEVKLTKKKSFSSFSFCYNVYPENLIASNIMQKVPFTKIFLKITYNLFFCLYYRTHNNENI